MQCFYFQIPGYDLKATKNLILCISMYHKGEKRDLNKESFQTFYLILIKVPETGTITPVLQIGQCMNGERVFSPEYTR